MRTEGSVLSFGMGSGVGKGVDFEAGVSVAVAGEVGWEVVVFCADLFFPNGNFPRIRNETTITAATSKIAVINLDMLI